MIHSAGIIPFRVNDGVVEFFVGPPGGCKTDYWAFMKGQVDDDDVSFKDTAVREFCEETGLSFDEETIDYLIPLGSVMQNPGKCVHAFGLYVSDIDPDVCFSNLVDDGSGIPEIDDYCWMSFDTIRDKTHKTHITFYEQLDSMARWT